MAGKVLICTAATNPPSASPSGVVGVNSDALTLVDTVTTGIFTMALWSADVTGDNADLSFSYEQDETTGIGFIVGWCKHDYAEVTPYLVATNGAGADGVLTASDIVTNSGDTVVAFAYEGGDSAQAGAATWGGDFTLTTPALSQQAGGTTSAGVAYEENVAAGTAQSLTVDMPDAAGNRYGLIVAVLSDTPATDAAAEWNGEPAEWNSEQATWS